MSEMDEYMRVFNEYYTDKILLGHYQASVIALQIFRLKRRCNFLVFGCGNDSRLWAELNKYGTTVFLEGSLNWKNKVLAANPDLRIELYDVGANTVSESLADNVQYLPPPAALFERRFDLIFIDGPQGFKSSCPGRALPIIWSKEIACSHTNIFLDDYERALETKYFNRYFPESTVISDPKRGKKGLLAWYDPFLQIILTNLGSPVKS